VRSQRKDRRAVGSVIAALKDPEWSVVFRAAQALGELRDPRAIQPLLQAAARPGEMFDSNVAVRYLSRALYAIGKRSVKPAVAHLTHRHANVRRVAAASLARLQARRAIPALIRAVRDPDKKVREWARVALGHIGVAAIPSLVAAMRQPDLHVKGWLEEVGQIAWVLVEMGQPAVPPLLRALEDSSAHLRAGAISALGQLKDSRALIPVISCLRSDRAATVRWQAAIALGKMGDAAATTSLIAALRDPNARVRECAARALWALKDRRSVSSLIAALHDSSPQVRWAAAGALGEINDHRAVLPLCALLKRRAFSSKGWEGGSGPANALASLKDRRAVQPLIAALWHPHEETRWGAAHALGVLRDRRAVRPLIDVLQSRDARAPKGAAILALGNLADPRAIQPIAATHQQVRHGVEFSVEALASIGTRRAFKCLVALLKETRLGAQSAMEHLPVEACPLYSGYSLG